MSSRPEVDPVLVSVLTNVDNGQITLNVGGATVTGKFVQQDEWIRCQPGFRYVSKRIAQRNEGDPTEDALPAQPGLDRIAPEYIHLINARFITGDGFMPSPEVAGMCWRGRLDAVSGWCLGSMAPSAGKRDVA